MGCFSFLCKECGNAILSTSFRRQQVKLFLLRNGEVIQEMEGEYDSYGRVFTEDLKDSIYWKNPTPEIPLEEYWQKDGDTPDNHGYWLRVTDLMFHGDKSNGIAAIHSDCFTGEVPHTRSESDPNQGWGEDFELFGETDPNLEIQ
jgi:hypothetical protein